MKLRRPRRFATAVVTGALVGGSIAYWLRTKPAPEATEPEPELGEVRQGRFEDADLERRKVPVRLVPVAAGVGQPTDLAFVPGHPAKLVVASKWGSLHLVDLAAGTRTNWIWLPVIDALESGVLGLAFAPDFPESGRFFVHQTPRTDDGRIESAFTELRVNPETLATPEVVANVLEVPQPHGTHNAGQIAFGPDGMLYVALGDGHAGNPERRSQDRSSLHGSLLRLDVSAPGRAAVPPDNPFVGEPDVRPEIWAYGLRNPWRFTFDRRGRVIVADVGQMRWEEVNVVAAGDNLGWPDREGTDCYPEDAPCREGSFVDPVLVYDHMDGISITGGVEWEVPGPLEGTYLFGDFGTGRIWAATLPETPGEGAELMALGRFDVSPSAFARDSRAVCFSRISGWSAFIASILRYSFGVQSAVALILSALAGFGLAYGWPDTDADDVPEAAVAPRWEPAPLRPPPLDLPAAACTQGVLADLPETWTRDAAEQHLREIVATQEGVELLDMDCDAAPCVAWLRWEDGRQHPRLTYRWWSLEDAPSAALWTASHSYDAEGSVVQAVVIAPSRPSAEASAALDRRLATGRARFGL